jgi:Cdc6-like AAA superfamily ATPase
MIYAAEYYEQHREQIEEILDQMVKAAQLDTGEIDDPAMRFAAIRLGLESDPSRAATACALAIMRLAELTSVAES